jgi:hypothetical protein
LAAHTSPRTTYLSAAALCAAMALLFMRQLPGLRLLVRPIYVRKGILPEAVRGVEAQQMARVEGGTVA